MHHYPQDRMVHCSDPLRPFVCADIHVVEPGDTLYSISQMHEVSVSALMQVNQILNPYNLKIGQKICIPAVLPECNGTLYEIRVGDTLYMMAKRFGITLDALMEANPTMDPYNLRIGDQICIPPRQDASISAEPDPE